MTHNDDSKWSAIWTTFKRILILKNLQLCSPAASALLSALNEKWGDTRHLSPWKEQVFEKHSFASQWQSFGGEGGDGWGGTARTHSWGRELHQAPPDKIFLQRKHSFEPNLLYLWFYWQGHKYLWVMSCCSPATDSALPLRSVWAR